MRLKPAILAMLITSAAAAAPRPAPVAAPAWQPWVDRLAGLLADPALPLLDHARFGPFFAGLIDLPATELAQCKDVTGYTPQGTPFAFAVATALIPTAAPCPDRRFGRLGFAVGDRSDSDTDYLVTALTAKFGPPATDNVWFAKPGGQVSAVREAWEIGGVISLVVLLEPDEGGLVGVSIVRGYGPTPPKLRPGRPAPAPDSFEAMINRMFQ